MMKKIKKIHKRKRPINQYFLLCLTICPQQQSDTKKAHPQGVSILMELLAGITHCVCWALPSNLL